MRSSRRHPRKRSWLVPEVVQTSAMDCGPAALACLLQGHGIQASYGRLREACQTEVDGSSIDAMEEVAVQAGLEAEQVMLPFDHVFLSEAAALPAVVVVNQADGASHFVVVWRRHGALLQVMDPSVGRRWIGIERFRSEMLQHETSVDAHAWREWAQGTEFLSPMMERLRALGASRKQATDLIMQALSDPGWFEVGALDATTRLVSALRRSGGVTGRRGAVSLLFSLLDRTLASPDDILRFVPGAYWSVIPDGETSTPEVPRLKLRGAVLVKVRPRSDDNAVDDELVSHTASEISPEVRAALAEPPGRPLAHLWKLLGQEGKLGMWAVLGAVAVAAGLLVLEMLLFRGLLDMANVLHSPYQRLAALAALLGFALLLIAFEVPIFAESMRMGRHLEIRLRMALLDKLPRLPDRYFQSRPISDMADRSHSLHVLRLLPSLGIQFVQTFFALILTLAGIAWLDLSSLPYALAIGLTCLLLPLATQPVMLERDLRTRNHHAALTGFYLDAMLGMVPIRTHNAQRAVLRQHESLLVEWTRASYATMRASLFSNGLQSMICAALAGSLLITHFVRVGGVSGGDLLLVFWTLKLPTIGGLLAGIARQYPAQRNILTRLMEPLNAPEPLRPSDNEPSVKQEPPPSSKAVSIRIDSGAVMAGGRIILDDLDLHIGAGEHVAVIGASGAGKSTLVGLLLGWHRLVQGSLRLNDQDLDEEGLHRLRRQTAWVDPAVHIWNRSLLDNLHFACDQPALGNTGRAIEAAHLEVLLRTLPQGLQTYLGEGGALLSGGEGQRVRLARALLQGAPNLVLLDEPFRGLDAERRRSLLADAREWWRDSTLICVTHDVSETLAFPRVLVVDDGRIVEDGVPKDLAVSLSRYRELLLAERVVRGQYWAGSQWRRVRIEGGGIVSRPSTDRDHHQVAGAQS